MQLPIYKLGERALKRQKPPLKGTDIRHLQQKLKKLGYMPSKKVDGIYGHDTEKAVKVYQKENSLIKTGVADFEIFDSIEEKLKKEYLNFSMVNKNPQHNRYSSLKIEDHHINWKRKTKFMNKILAYSSFLFLSEEKEITVVKAINGKQNWRKKIDNNPNLYPSIDNHILFLPLKDEIKAISISEGKQLWSYTGSSQDLTFSPFPYKDKLIIGKESGMLALDQLNGKKIWQNSLTGTIYTPPTVQEDALLIPAGEKGLIISEIETGNIIKVPKFPLPIKINIVVNKNIAYVTAGEKRLYAIKNIKEDNEIIWKLEMGKGEFYPPIIDDNEVYFISKEGICTTINNETGKNIWTQDFKEKIINKPLLTQNLLYLPTEDGIKALCRKTKKITLHALKGRKTKGIVDSKKSLYILLENGLYSIS